MCHLCTSVCKRLSILPYTTMYDGSMRSESRYSLLALFYGFLNHYFGTDIQSIKPLTDNNMVSPHHFYVSHKNVSIIGY